MILPVESGMCQIYSVSENLRAAEWIIRVLPDWFIFLLALAVAARVLFSSRTYPWVGTSSLERFWVGLSILNVAAFYLAIWQDWLPLAWLIAFSRIVFVFFLVVQLWVSHREAKRGWK